MRYRELTEAPIQDFETHGDFSQPGSFEVEKDLRRITNPKAKEKIIRLFSKTPFIFNVHFVNHTQGYENSGEGWPTDNPDSRLRQGINNVNTVNAELGTHIKNAPGVITFVMAGNPSGQDQLSAWIIAHRFAHSFYYDFSEGPFGKLDLELDDQVYALTPFIENQKVDLNDLYHAILTMKSARSTPKLGRPIEAFAEATAQYLITGHVRLNRHDTLNPHGVIEVVDSAKFDATITKIEAFLNSKIPETLRSYVGKVAVF